MKLRIHRYLAASLVLHAVLLTAMVMGFHSKPFDVVFKPRLVVFVETVRGSTGQHRHKRRDGKAASAHRSKPISLRDLGVFSNRGLPLAGGDASNADSVGERPSTFGFENQVTTQTSPILSYLFHQIDNGLAFPSELREARFSGEVTAVLNFNDRGEWVDSVSEIGASTLMSRYFRVYIIHRLRALLSEPVPSNLWKAQPQVLQIEVRFIFDIVSPESVEGAQVGPSFGASADPSKFSQTDTDGGQSVESKLTSGRQGQYGRRFSFYRVHLASKLDWKLGPLAGYGIMPAVGIDPGWFAEKIKDMWHHRGKIDPLLRYREDSDW